MIYTNYELKHTECNVCGHDTECFLQYEYGAPHAMCLECLRTSYRTLDCE